MRDFSRLSKIELADLFSSCQYSGEERRPLFDALEANFTNEEIKLLLSAKLEETIAWAKDVYGNRPTDRTS